MNRRQRHEAAARMAENLAIRVPSGFRHALRRLTAERTWRTGRTVKQGEVLMELVAAAAEKAEARR